MGRGLPAFAALLVACGSADGRPPVGPTEDDLLRAIEGYASWDHAPSWPDIAPSDSVHGAYVQIWCNAAASDAFAAGVPDGVIPVGSAIVKEAYEDDVGSVLIATTAMWKSEAEVWTWARLSSSGDVSDFGQPASCVDCHDAGTDSVLSVTW